MKVVNKTILGITSLLTFSPPAFAHIGEHQLSLSQSIMHFLTSPLHAGLTIFGLLSVLALNVYWVLKNKMS